MPAATQESSASEAAIGNGHSCEHPAAEGLEKKKRSKGNANADTDKEAKRPCRLLLSGHTCKRRPCSERVHPQAKKRPWSRRGRRQCLWQSSFLAVCILKASGSRTPKSERPEASTWS